MELRGTMQLKEFSEFVLQIQHKFSFRNLNNVVKCKIIIKTSLANRQEASHQIKVFKLFILRSEFIIKKQKMLITSYNIFRHEPEILMKNVIRSNN